MRSVLLFVFSLGVLFLSAGTTNRWRDSTSFEGPVGFNGSRLHFNIGTVNSTGSIIHQFGQFKNGLNLDKAFGLLDGVFLQNQDTVNNAYNIVGNGDFSPFGLGPRTSILGYLNLSADKNGLLLISADTSGNTDISIQGQYGSGNPDVKLQMNVGGLELSQRNGSEKYGLVVDDFKTKILAKNNTYTWPNSGPANGYVLGTDGSGNLSWVPGGGGGGSSSYGGAYAIQFADGAGGFWGNNQSLYIDDTTGNVYLHVKGQYGSSLIIGNGHLFTGGLLDVTDIQAKSLLLGDGAGNVTFRSGGGGGDYTLFYPLPPTTQNSGGVLGLGEHYDGSGGAGLTFRQSLGRMDTFHRANGDTIYIDSKYNVLFSNSSTDTLNVVLRATLTGGENGLDEVEFKAIGDFGEINFIADNFYHIHNPLTLNYRRKMNDNDYVKFRIDTSVETVWY